MKNNRVKELLEKRKIAYSVKESKMVKRSINALSSVR